MEFLLIISVILYKPRISFQVTTTDGEQPDDSFDLIDMPEMSPPPVTSSQSSTQADHQRHSDTPTTTTAVSHSSPSQPASPSSPISVAAPATQTTPPPLPPSSSPSSSPLCGFETGLPTYCSQGHNSNNHPTEGTIVPPSTPITGVHQEQPKFIFGTGRTPPLPDLKSADFFR